MATVKQFLKSYNDLKKILKVAGDEGAADDFVDQILNNYLYDFGTVKQTTDNKYTMMENEFLEHSISSLPEDIFKVEKVERTFWDKIRRRAQTYNISLLKDKVSTVAGLIDKNLLDGLDYSLKFADEKTARLRKNTASALREKADMLKKARVLIRKQFYDKNSNNKYAPTKHMVAVHATSYAPKKNKEGKMYIESTAMATDFYDPRNTVHFSLNHVVHGHTDGNWEGMQNVVLVPFNELMAINGEPASSGPVDTFFSANPDGGLVLPDESRVVTPGHLKNDSLYIIGPKKTIYKNKSFSDEQKQLILKNIHIPNYDLMSDTERKQTMQNLSDNEFATAVRDIATTATMEKMGFNYNENAGSHIYQGYEEHFVEPLKNAGIHTNGSQYAHCESEYGKIEDRYRELLCQVLILDYMAKNKDVKVKNEPSDTIYAHVNVENDWHNLKAGEYPLSKEVMEQIWSHPDKFIGNLEKIIEDGSALDKNNAIVFARWRDKTMPMAKNIVRISKTTDMDSFLTGDRGSAKNNKLLTGLSKNHS